jgi:hypothetical protein
VTGTRPVIVGYLLRPLPRPCGPPDPAEARSDEELQRFAERTGHELAAIFRDNLHGRPCAVHAMIARTRREPIAAIALANGAVLQPDHRRVLDDASVRILSADPSP